MERKKLVVPAAEETGGNYFAAPAKSKKFSSGCELLNCVLGGGLALNRIINFVGDKSTGKTLLAIEACVNFARKHGDGLICYREIEAAFDKPYAAALGLPLDRVDFMEDKECLTVEDLFNDLNSFITKVSKKPGRKGLFVVDSLDPLSDKGEMESEFGQASMGMQKAKDMSKLFRKLNQRMAKANITVLIVSQVRTAIGVTFGKQTTRAGGRALDFYASQILYLAHIQQLKRTIDGVERKVGVRIRAKCEKNKVGLPFRECEFNIQFGYGIDDLAAGIDWLEEVGRFKELGVKVNPEAFLKLLRKAGPEEFQALRRSINETTKAVWWEIEAKFLPERTKYG